MPECLFPTCSRHAQPNGMCVSHRIYAASKIEPTVIKPIDKKSAKTKVSDKEYKKIVSQYFAASNKCEILSPVCTKIMEGLHHMKKRGEFLMDKRFLKRSCNACNSFLEANTDWGIENGFILSKFNEYDVPTNRNRLDPQV